ncbi:unnamed protein product [Symbiodinium sp. CCMP2592]|nr:unnamed protein product [Symbiodinium sp. CCMP2592]
MGSHHSTPNGSIDTNALEWDVDMNNVKATGLVTIEIIGTGCQSGETWTVGSTSASGARVHFVVNSGRHAMVLLTGGFYSTNQPGKTYAYVLIERIVDHQKYRLIHNIKQYTGWKSWELYDCGITMATADKLVDIAREDLKRRWASDFRNPMQNGEESFCLFYAMNVLRALGVLKNLKPVDAELWTKDQMSQIIKFVDPSWKSPPEWPCVLM